MRRARSGASLDHVEVVAVADLDVTVADWLFEAAVGSAALVTIGEDARRSGG
ncbi:MAG: hypothetical protein WCA29_14650 [Jiangellales bacterium]